MTVVAHSPSFRGGPVWAAEHAPPIDDLLDLLYSGWRTRAACAAADWRLFEPVSAMRTGGRIPPRARLAATFCDGCEVRDRCGEEADRDALIGVWSGAWRTGQGGNYLARHITPAATPAA